MIQRSLLAARTRLKEMAQYSPALRTVRAALLAAKSRAASSPAARFDLLCRAYTDAGHAPLQRWLAAAIRRLSDNFSSEDLDWRKGPSRSIYEKWLSGEPVVSRTVVLKAPGPGGEKGVILSTFEYNWLRFLRDPDTFRELSRQYHFIFSTSWSPTDYGLLARALKLDPDATFFVQSCSYEEIPKIQNFDPRLRCLETLPCDWLNPDLVSPRPHAERDIDLVMVSNWAPFKRHWALFNALRDLPENLRVVCIGQPDSSRTLADIQKLQKDLGAPQKIEYLQSIPIAEVSALQARAKVAIILSLWEGCCVAAAEGLMAGASLVMCRDAHVGPRSYIGDKTGTLLSRKPRAAEIAGALERSAKQDPRAFAANRLSCHTSRQSLNKLLKEHDARAGRPWTQDLAAVCWKPHPKLISEEDRARLLPCYQDLHQRWPEVFGPDLIDQSWR